MNKKTKASKMINFMENLIHSIEWVKSNTDHPGLDLAEVEVCNDQKAQFFYNNKTHELDCNFNGDSIRLQCPNERTGKAIVSDHEPMIKRVENFGDLRSLVKKIAEQDTTLNIAGPVGGESSGNRQAEK